MNVVIIGGGLAGLLSAWELSRAGATVTVLEKNPSTGMESSWAGGGILSPLYPWRYPDSVNQLACWSQPVYPALVREIEAVSGESAEYLNSGLLVLDKAEIGPGLDWASRYAASVEQLRPEQIARLAPGLAPLKHDALYFPEVGQIRNPRLVHALRVALHAEGVVFHDNIEVEHLDTRNGRVVEVRGAHQTYEADVFVMTAGAWSGRLLRALDLDARIEPVRGQMLLLQGHPGDLKQIVLSGGHYLVPRQDGLILAGSTMERVGFERATTTAARRVIEQFAHQVLPASVEMPVVKHWAGFRPGSADGVPWISRVPGVNNLFINSGHFRNGVVTAPASARLLKNLVFSESPMIDSQPYTLHSVHSHAEI